MLILGDFNGMLFPISNGHVWGWCQEFVNDMDEPAFLKRELVDGYWQIRVHDHTGRPVLIQAF